VFENLTVFANLELALADSRRTWHTLFARLDTERREWIEATLARIGLSGESRKPAGLLSHGQKQWLEIGMLLIHDRQLLLLDEPVAGMTAKKGEVTCILGRNGVGKTSLLRAIIGLNSIRSGHIRWEDHELTQLPTHQRARAGLGLVPQGREIFPRLSVLENLMTGFAT